MGDALCKSSTARRRPVGHRPGRGGESRDADSKHHPGDEHAGEAAGESHEHRGTRPDRGKHRQRLSRAKSIGHPSADDLKQEVRIGKHGKDQPDLRIGEAQLGLEDGRSRADVYPDDVINQIHQAEEDQHHPCGRNRGPAPGRHIHFSVHQLSP